MSVDLKTLFEVCFLEMNKEIKPYVQTYFRQEIQEDMFQNLCGKKPVEV